MPFLHFDADPDLNPDLNPDPDPLNKVMRIRVHWSSDTQRLQFWASMESMALHSSIWASKLLNVDFNSDSDAVPAFLSNAYPDQDPASRNNSDAFGSATLTGIMQDYVPCTWFISKINKRITVQYTRH